MFNLRSSLLATLVSCAFVLSAPAPAVNTDPNAPVDDVAVLNFALTLEHLENAFYNEGLSKLSDQDFADAGFEPWVRGRFNQIAHHEATHVTFLSTALGDKATKPCDYNFPYNDPHSFAALSMAFETVGASAYLGAAKLLQNKDTLTEAASILAVESRQAAWVNSAVLKSFPWDGPFETPLGPNGIFSIAANFIKSCPSSNPPLPVKVLPALTVDPSTAAENQVVTLSFDLPSSTSAKPLFVAYFTGIDVKFSDIQNQGGKYTTTIPDRIQGTVYAAVVDTKDVLPSDGSILTGLAMLEYPFLSTAENVVS